MRVPPVISGNRPKLKKVGIAVLLYLQGSPENCLSGPRNLKKRLSAGTLLRAIQRFLFPFF
jgi:hypothetical protein